MDPKFMKKIKPYFLVVLVQFGFSGFGIIAKSALNQGMSHYALSVYRNAIAAVLVAPFALILERKIRPKMTFSVMYKIVLLALAEPVIDQNLYYAGLKYTTPTFTAAMCNILPAVTFLLAWALRLERVSIKKLPSQAKIVGTLVTLGGAMIMTLIKGSIIGLPWTKLTPNPQAKADTEKAEQDSVRGTLMITSGCLCWSFFYILQAITLKSYPAGLSLTGLICTAGALQGAALTLVAERGNPAVWTIGWDTSLLAYVYGGVICSGVTYYISGDIMKEKGPVFVTSFNPLNMVLVALMSSIILAEQLDVGKVTGAMVIVAGLYLVIWGKTKDVSESSYPDSEMIDPEKGSATNATSIAPEKGHLDVSKPISGDNVV